MGLLTSAKAQIAALLDWLAMATARDAEMVCRRSAVWASATPQARALAIIEARSADRTVI